MSCSSSGHIPRAGVDPIASDADARSFVTALCLPAVVSEVIVITLDERWRGIAVLRVDGAVHPDAVLGVAEAVCNGAHPPDTAAAVLVSSRPSHPVESADVERWLEVSDRFDDAGIELIEWYVVSEHGIECPRDLFGEPPRWSEAWWCQ